MITLPETEKVLVRALIIEHLDEWRQLSGSANDGDASELHGLICGLLAAAPGTALERIMHALEPLGEWQWQQSHRQQIQQGVLESATQLDSEDFSFEPLLPDDDTPLADRTHCLGLWCGGFNAGFGAGRQDLSKANGHSSSKLSDDEQEVLRDMEQIARVDPNLLDADDVEELEASYAELLEYVRTAVMLMRQSSMNAQQAENPSQA